MQLTASEFLLATAGSFLAGAINTLAGNGSIITLSLLTDLVGLPGNVANATNRVGVLLQAAGSSTGFMKNNLLKFNTSGYIIFWTIIGAIGGVYCAIIIPNEDFLVIFKYLMLFMLVIVLIKPERWLKMNEESVPLSPWVSIPVFIILGFYGGFIQMGMGIFFLAVLVLVAKYNILQANAVKTFVILIYTSIVLLIFAWQGLVNWEIGIIMAIGQTIGGYLTAAYAIKVPNINVWAYRLLIFVIILAILTQFGFFKIFI